VIGVAVRSRLGAVLAALVNAAMTVLLNQSWVLVWAAVELDLLSFGFPGRFSAVLRWLPSSWGLAAIDAAARGAWPVAAAALGGTVAVIGLALLLWARLLVVRTTSRPLQRAPRGSAAHGSPLDRLADTGRAGAVAAKELRTWSRDLMRLHLFFFALFFGVLYTLVPLLIDWPGMLPWAGLIVVAMAAATSANLIGLDGTALWLSLVDPGAERAEVRGRQLAWLLQVAPVAIALTVVGTLAGGGSATWPWALGLLAATLGGGAGLVVLVSVYALVPVTEPQRRSGNPLEAGAIFGQVLVVLLLVTLTAAPPALVAYLGDRWGPGLAWAAVPVGVATGVWLAIHCGRLAYRRLSSTGPELLATMRSGGTQARTAVRPGRPRPQLTTGRQALVTFLWIACWIPLFPQGLLPLWMIFQDSGNRLWFLALHLRDPYRAPTAVAFVVAGLVMLYFATVIPLRAGRTGAERG
jgi:ABC-2 type transport system permease protein